jgi:alpha/beta superfamily hydrolase
MVPGEVEVMIPGLDGGPSLAARVHAPPMARRMVVLCHPHPLYGGSMHSPVPLILAKALAEQGRGPSPIAWARFDFRGVGASEGKYDDGRGEVEDVRAVIRYLRQMVPGAALSVCGHSFGSLAGLRAAAAEDADRALLVAPSVRFFEFPSTWADLRWPATTAIFVGTEDEFIDPAEARALGARIGAEVRVFEGFDHHFLRSRRALATAATPFLVPELPGPPPPPPPASAGR